MAAPTWVTGQVLTASDVNTWFVPNVAYKSSVTTRSTTSITADPDLQLTLGANAWFEVRGVILYVTSLNTSINFTFAGPSGFTGGYSGTFFSAPYGHLWTDSVSSGSSGTTVYTVQIQGVVNTSSTSGTFSFNWASGASGTNMSVGVGSYLLTTQIG